MNDTIRTQIEALDSMRLPDLQTRYAEVLGEETRAPNRKFLIRKITEALEAGAGDAPVTDEATPDAVPDEPTPSDDAVEADAAPETPTPDAPEADIAQATEQPDAADDEATETRLTKLSVPELQALYLESVGRSTGSSHKRYLVWKIRQAQRGRIPVGPRGQRRADGEAVDFKVLPLRMEADLVAQLDEARERLGLKSRMELFRRSLHAYLLEAGEVRVAEMFAAEA